jgi:hypothetical protein
MNKEVAIIFFLKTDQCCNKILGQVNNILFFSLSQICKSSTFPLSEQKARGALCLFFKKHLY